MPSFCSTCSKPNATSTCSRCKCTYYCNTNCQRKDWKHHKKICKTLANKSTNPTPNTSTTNDDEKSTIKTTKTIHKKSKSSKKDLFRIEKVENKGLGMIATRDISAGTIIINEPPILSLITDSNIDIRAIKLDEFSKIFAKPILQKYKNLTSKQQELIKNLSYKYDGSILDIFLNNSLTNEDNGFHGVYINISRINHSCNANCLHWIQSKNNAFNARIIALRRIKKGDEITINYCGWNPLIYKQRMDKLKYGWKIENCKCNKCNKKYREKWDKIIMEYMELDEIIPKIQEPNEKYRVCKKMVTLIESKFDGNPQLLYRHCWDLSNASLVAFRRDEFVENLINTVKYKRLAHGRDTKVPEQVEELVNQMPPDIQKKIKAKIYKKK